MVIDEQILEKKTSLNWLWFSLIVIFIVWFLFAIILFYSIKNWSISGQYGDSFGLLNTLFSGFAFCGIIFTVYLQKNELEFQRLELVATRNELRKSAISQEKSSKSLELQGKSLVLSSKLNGLNSALSLEIAKVNTFGFESHPGKDALEKAEKIKSAILDLLNDNIKEIK